MARLFKNGSAFTDEDLRELRSHCPSLSDKEFKNITESVTAYMIPEYEQCCGFLADLRGVAYGDSSEKNGGVMSIKHIAELLQIKDDKAKYFMRGCAAWRLTERQGGKWVI